MIAGLALRLGVGGDQIERRVRALLEDLHVTAASHGCAMLAE